MPFAPVSPITLRLLACAEAFSHEEDGAIGHDDWPALAALLERELAVLTRLARDGAGPRPDDPRLLAGARTLRARYSALERRIAEARVRAAEELAGLNRAGGRLRSVRGAYGAGAGGATDTRSDAA